MAASRTVKQTDAMKYHDDPTVEDVKDEEDYVLVDSKDASDDDKEDDSSDSSDNDEEDDSSDSSDNDEEDDSSDSSDDDDEEDNSSDSFDDDDEEDVSSDASDDDDEDYSSDSSSDDDDKEDDSSDSNGNKCSKQSNVERKTRKAAVLKLGMKPVSNVTRATINRVRETTISRSENEQLTKSKLVVYKSPVSHRLAARQHRLSGMSPVKEEPRITPEATKKEEVD